MNQVYNKVIQLCNFKQQMVSYMNIIIIITVERVCLSRTDKVKLQSVNNIKTIKYFNVESNKLNIRW